MRIGNKCAIPSRPTAQAKLALVPRRCYSCRHENLSDTERFHSRGPHVFKVTGTKEGVYIRKEFDSQVVGLKHQHGRRFIVLEHQHGRRDVM